MDASVSPPERGLPRLKRRREFLAAAKARKCAMPGFVLQARRRRADENACSGDACSGARIGFTASKKTGNAVARNRAKRRLRALADEVGPVRGRAGWDYVLIACAETTATRDFARMRAELEDAFERVHQERKPGARSGAP